MLSLKPNNQEFMFQAPTNIWQSDYNNTFILTSNLTLISMKKSQHLFSWNLVWF